MARTRKTTIYVLNGPNLNLLGGRETDVYGKTTLAEIEAHLKAKGKKAGVNVECRQSNHEGVLIDWVQEAGKKAQALILNPGGYTHTSVALADAVAALTIPVAEVHLSNIHAREEFRRVSLISAHTALVVCGAGARGYDFALEALVEKLT